MTHPSSTTLSRIHSEIRRNLLLKPALKLFRSPKRDAHFWLLSPDVAHHDTICREIMLQGFYERDLLEGMACLVPDRTGTFLDIGANIGNHSIFLSQRYARVVSFEPVPRNCWIFKANRHLNSAHNITLVEKGLGSAAGSFQIECEDPMQTNTRLEPAGKTVASSGIAEVIPGDDAIETLGIDRVVGVKIDVEGHEPEVIRGLARTLHRDRPVVFWEAFSQADASRSKILLQDIGYRSFYHLARTRGVRGLMQTLRGTIGGRTELVPLESCERFSGLNVASCSDLRLR